MPGTLKERARWPVALLTFHGAPANGELGINLPRPATVGAQEIYDVHMLTLAIATVLMAIVTAVVVYSVWSHRKSRNFQADVTFHESWFGRWGWIIVPVLVLAVDLAIAGSAKKTLERLWSVPNGVDMIDIKVTGHQWWWEYDYLDHGVKLESRALSKEESGDLYLRDVDNPLILPVGTKIRFLHTSADVLHAFWVPELGFKKDAIPGYVTETWTEVDREGVYRGQCAELCGTWHSRMPVVVKVVSREAFSTWIEERKAELEKLATQADPNRTWTKAELMAQGEAFFNTKCAACHQANGEGLPPAFPPLKGSKVVVGPLGEHLDVVLNGRPGTAMQPWGQLSDYEIAAIVTYERNAWGNDTGDVVQPRQIAAGRGDSKSAAR